MARPGVTPAYILTATNTYAQAGATDEWVSTGMCGGAKDHKVVGDDAPGAQRRPVVPRGCAGRPQSSSSAPVQNTAAGGGVRRSARGISVRSYRELDDDEDAEDEDDEEYEHGEEDGDEDEEEDD